MAVHDSDQITKLNASPPERLPPNESGGRQRIIYFNHTVPAGNAAVSDTIRLQDIAAGDRIVGGFATWEAMSTAGGTAQMQLGDGTTADKYLGTTSVDAAGSTEFANSIALNYGEKVTSKFTLTATVLGEAWAAGQRISGHVKVVRD